MESSDDGPAAESTRRGRARSVAELREVMSGFTTAAGVAAGLGFTPRPSDVFIATYPKGGTTLMQQIVHGLRTGGDMDFRDISEVVPWLEVAADLGQDPNDEQRANPRAFKTHLDRASVPAGGRSIYLLRDPEVTLVSFYHFFSGWFFEPEAIDLETFALEFVLAREGRFDYWGHLLSWWPHRNDEDVLYLLYEDVVADLEATVRRVDAFLGLSSDEDRIRRATGQASLDFMKRFPDRWEDPLLREKRNPAMGLPIDAKSTKVRRGSASGESGALSEQVIRAWRERWAAVVEPATGCVDYAALRRHVASEHD